jgi:GNAT superfamily N-acetyltransferase
VVSEIEIRLANDDEVEGARAVLKAAYAEYEDWFPKENWLRYLTDVLDLEGRASASELLVAIRDGEVLGCVSYFPPGSKASYPSDAFSEHWPPEWAAFRLLAVDPAARGEGLGHRLTEVCVERARDQGAPVLGLHTTDAMKVARAMYERLGFKRAPKYDFHPSPQVAVEAYRLEL